MNNKRIQLLLTAVAAWISLLLIITTTYAGNIVIGGNYTNIGTIIIISPKPGDTPQTNGTALLNNLAAITADVNNPYVIKLGPGIYDIGTGSLQMKSYVDLEGSGEITTTITGHIDSFTSGVVQGTSNAEIRFLTVQNTGGGTYEIAIYNTSASPKITNVTASASGGGDSWNYGVFNNASSSPTMMNVTASASGGIINIAVANASSSPIMTNMTAFASGGGGDNVGVFNASSSSPAMTNVTASASGGNNSNFGVRNSSSSPTMTDVTASASGGGASFNHGVYNDHSSPTMTNVTASASGGTSSLGVDNSSSSPTLTDVTASASGGTSNYAVRNSSSSPTMTNVTASASGGTNDYGVLSTSTGTIMINNSVIIGSTTTVYNGTNTTTRIGNTKLDGGPVSNSGTLTCVGAYNGNYVALGASCQ